MINYLWGIFLFYNIEENLIVIGDKIKGFEVLGENKIFVEADVRLENNNIIVSSKK